MDLTHNWLSERPQIRVEMKVMFILLGIRRREILQRFRKVLKLFLLFFPFHLSSLAGNWALIGRNNQHDCISLDSVQMYISESLFLWTHTVLMFQMLFFSSRAIKLGKYTFKLDLSPIYRNLSAGKWADVILNNRLDGALKDTSLSPVSVAQL